MSDTPLQAEQPAPAASLPARPTPEEAPAPDLSARQVIGRIVREYLRPYFGMAFFAIGANAIVAATTGALPWLIQQAVDNVFGSQDASMLVWVPLAAIAIMSAGALAEYVGGVVMTSIGQKVVAAVQNDLFERIVRADLAWVQSVHSGRLISSFMTDAVRLRDTMTATAFNLTQNLLKVVALVGAMFYLNPLYALMGVAIIPVAAAFMGRLGRKTRKATRRGLEGTGDLTALVSEALGGFRVVKAYGQEDREIARARDKIASVLAHNMRAVRARVSASPITGVTSSLGVAAVLYFGGMQVQSGAVSLGELMGFLSAMMLTYQPLKAVANQQTVMQEGVAAAARLFPVLDVEPMIVDGPDAQALRVSDGAIRFDNVSFDYGTGIPALQNVCLEIPKDHMVALVGPSGAGKSTLLNLVARFYDVTGGSVTIDGQDVRKVTLASLRQASSLVTQDPFLFDDTVRANIAYGTPDASDRDIQEAARQAAAHDFIMALPDGYETMVGEDGTRLSGGQRQRIAIARAMLKNAPILLLDEATSSLDTASEMQVQEALKTLMKGRTTLVIAHRLSTIMHADQIYVVESGRIVEQGTHDELSQKGGLYQTLYRSQFADGEPVQSPAEA